MKDFREALTTEIKELRVRNEKCND